MSPRYSAWIGLRRRLASSLSLNSLNSRSCALCCGGRRPARASRPLAARASARQREQGAGQDQSAGKRSWLGPRDRRGRPKEKGALRLGRNAPSINGVPALPEEVVDRVDDLARIHVDQQRVVPVADPLRARRRIRQAVHRPDRSSSAGRNSSAADGSRFEALITLAERIEIEAEVESDRCRSR